MKKKLKSIIAKKVFKDNPRATIKIDTSKSKSYNYLSTKLWGAE